jgi:tight adherence protein C
MNPMVILAAATSALAVGLLFRVVVPPPRRLHTRVEPYVSPTISTLTISRDIGPFRSVFGPIVRDIANRVGGVLDRSGSGVTFLRLRQAGWFFGLSESEMVMGYRMAQLRALVLGIGTAAVLGQLLGASLALRLVLVGLGLLFGVTRTRGRLDKAIETRRETMKVEVYTVNQLLAMRVRAGGGVIQAVKATTERGSGEVVAELLEALRLHRSGWRGPDAFRRIAELTPEPFCARTYRLLASAEERGADLAGALLSLSEDVRETRRESIKRTATKRRAAMLVPTIAILAPVLILFVAAPLPYLITGWQ